MSSYCSTVKSILKYLQLQGDHFNDYFDMQMEDHGHVQYFSVAEILFTPINFLLSLTFLLLGGGLKLNLVTFEFTVSVFFCISDLFDCI